MTGLDSDVESEKVASGAELGKRVFIGEADPLEGPGEGKSRLKLEGLGCG